MKIGIIGAGYVGTATRVFAGQQIEALVYDIDPEKCSPEGTKLDDMNQCDLVFVCVPTPANKDGSCHVGIVESGVQDLREALTEDVPIVLRSTVPVETSENLGVYFMPEFLTERSWAEDVANCEWWILGVPELSKKYDTPTEVAEDNGVKLFMKMLKLAHEDKKISGTGIDVTTTQIAEITKLAKNAFFSTKVSFFNEVKEFCDWKGINFDAFRNFVTRDERVGDSHTRVPGPDQKRGFGGTCLPKDLNSLIHQMEEEGMKSHVLSAVKERNETVDRPSKDWELDKGRAIVGDSNEKKNEADFLDEIVPFSADGEL